MIRVLSLLLFAFAYLNGAGFWTLTGLEKANIYVKNEISILKPSTIKEIKQKMLTELKKDGIKTNQQDSPTLMISLEEIEGDETHYIYVKLALGEEVQTFRRDKSATFALTYDSNDFIEADNDELDSEVLASVELLLSQFSEHFKDDKE